MWWLILNTATSSIMRGCVNISSCFSVELHIFKGGKDALTGLFFYMW